MTKNLNKDQWIEIIEKYKNIGMREAVESYVMMKQKDINHKELRVRIRKKAYLLDNIGMEILTTKAKTGRPKKRDDSDIPNIIDELNENQKREIIESWIKNQRDKNDKNDLSGFLTLTNSLKAKILGMHRTSFYKKKTERKYKFEYLKEMVLEIFHSSKGIYGSRKISIILSQKDILISDRTLRNYMIRWGISTLTRRKKRKSEDKNIFARYDDLVKRDFNPQDDNIIATDVSYISARCTENFVYLSAAINHKTKRIESWKISEKNDSELVLKTISDINRANFILHSDHGSQYSSNLVIKHLKSIGGITSMGRVANSLDNREIEYFFGCLKGDYLNHIKTKNMSLEEITKHISWYIEWYNFDRIQKRLNWKTPAEASVLV